MLFAYLTLLKFFQQLYEKQNKQKTNGKIKQFRWCSVRSLLNMKVLGVRIYTIPRNKQTCVAHGADWNIRAVQNSKHKTHRTVVRLERCPIPLWCVRLRHGRDRRNVTARVRERVQRKLRGSSSSNF